MSFELNNKLRSRLSIVVNSIKAALGRYREVVMFCFSVADGRGVKISSSKNLHRQKVARNLPDKFPSFSQFDLEF